MAPLQARPGEEVMIRYALLILPSTNRVYAEAAIALTRAELELFNATALGGRLAEIGEERLGRVPYVTFAAEELSARDIALLANLSSAYAFFAVQGGLLRPIDLVALDRFDDDLLTIQKYAGKTNEQFTKLLINATLLSSAFAEQMLEHRFRLIDPLCGRGTTLNQALMYGFDAAGIDADAKSVEAYAAFIQTWLKRKRLKHQADFAPVRRNKQVVARRLHVTLAASKDDYRSGHTQELDVVAADTTRALEFYRPETFDLVVADTPYGVQHGSRTAEHGLARRPLALLAAAAPVWARLLVPGGALGISWNTYVAGREEAAEALAAAGLEPLESAPYLAFRHRVDQAIVRDIIIARKP